MTVTVYHNPRCSKSRAAMEYLEENGIEAEVVKYMDSPPDSNYSLNWDHRLHILFRLLLWT